MCFQNLCSGIISGLVCAILVWVFNSLFNITARSEIRKAMNSVVVYLESINNDMTWGTEDRKSEYYHQIVSKTQVVLFYIEKAKGEIKIITPLNCHKKTIVYQLNEIKKGCEYILTYACCAAPNKELVARISDFSEKYQTETANILQCRAKYIIHLLKYSKKKALYKSSIAGSPEEHEKIKNILGSMAN